MRVLQIIDSLHAGGAERVAVNFANALKDKIEFTGIIATREEGILKNQLDHKVFYHFLNKKSTVDFKAIKLLRKIIIQNKIDILHVHGTSFFLAFLLKLTFFKIKIVYHEHNGNRSSQSVIKNMPLLFCCLFFSKILVVNKQIEYWFLKLGFKKATYFSNFASIETLNYKETELKGETGKRIIYLANLRDPKNHQIILNAFYQLNLKKENWSLHFVGKNYQDTYYDNIIKQSNHLKILDSVYIYDSKSDILNILSQATIGVLCSTYEGFPVTLLEYGLAKLPVLSTNVGYCPELIIHNKTGLIFNPNSLDDIKVNLSKLISDFNLRSNLSIGLNQLVKNKYSKDIIINDLYLIYNNIK
jgi:glycosyltransferase involved in cell wall biosynthesis